MSTPGKEAAAMTTCPSEWKSLDLCRTGGCCPQAKVFKDHVEIAVPVVELGTIIEKRMTYRVLTLTKEQLQGLLSEMEE